MSIHAGTILHIGGQNIIDRIQSAGLGDVRVPQDVIREVGNSNVVDKVAGDPDFTFTLESFDVSTELEALLTGKYGASSDPASGAGAPDPDGTEYRWQDCETLNIVSPWKDANAGSGGTITGGHIIPAYYPTRINYRFGVTDNATTTVELGGGSYFYGDYAPVEQYEIGDSATTAFAADNNAASYRIGGAGGTSFRRIFGVLVNGVPQIRGVDYTETGANTNAVGAAGVTFTVAPATGAVIRFCYFTSAAQAFPDNLHPTSAAKPAAVRGRHICIYLGSGGARAKVGMVQAFELEATVDGEVEREFCNEESVGRRVDGTDTTGTLTVRSRDADAYFDLLAKMTGVAKTEVYGWLNDNPLPLEAQILNPKNPAQVIKTLYVPDAKLQVPGTPARVNAPTDFAIQYESRSGTFSAFKGAKP